MSSFKKLENTKSGISSVVDELKAFSASLYPSKDPWIGQPLSWLEFLSSKEHMQFPALSPKQVEFCSALLPDDAKKTFDPEFRKKQIGVLLAGKGCMAGDTEIILADGSRQHIKDLVEDGVYSYFSMGPSGKQLVSDGTPFYKKGEAQLFTVRTNYGKSCKVTSEHKFFTVDGWKKLSDIKVGDWICGAGKINLPEVDQISDDEALLMGLFIGDGCLTSGPVLAAKDQEVQDVCVGIGERIGCNTRIRKQVVNGYHKSSYVYFNGKTKKRTPGNPARKLLEKHGLWHKKAIDKRIPDTFFRCNESARVALLQGLYATDGWVCCSKTGKKFRWEVGYCSKSIQLVRDIQTLLLTFGIVSKLSCKKVLYRGERREYYQLIVRYRTDLNTFCGVIPTIPGNNESFSALKQWCSDTKTQGSGRMCPYELFGLAVVNVDKFNPGVRSQINKQLVQNLGGARQQTLYRWALESGYEKLASLTHPDILWEKVDSISPAGFGLFYSPTVFNTHNYLASGLYHHNSGKDAVSVMLACYFVQILLHLQDPFGYIYGASVPGEPIDILIVAPRGRTSEKVTFEKLKQRVLHWKWLKDRYKVVLSGREINPTERVGQDDSVEIGSNTIIFPNNIRVFSLNSSVESSEGFSIIVFICTEFAGFVSTDDKPNADKIYNTLYTSAKTRFPDKFLGLLISYPRYKGDAIMVKYEESLVLPHMYGMKASSWEFNPMLKKSNYDSELESSNPAVQEDARAKYLCEPGEKETRFISLPDRIKACIGDRSQIADFENYEEEVNGVRLLKKRLIKFNIPRQADVRKYVARVDLGLSNDRASLCVAHFDGRVIIDLLVHWIPDSRQNLVIDVDDPANIILDLKKRLTNIIFVSFDQWQSQSSINRLNRRGIVTDKLSLGPTEYNLFLNSLYARTIDLLDFPALTDPHRGELFHLTIDHETGKVDHEVGHHNDLTEAVCGATAMLIGTKKNMENIDQSISNVKPNLQFVGNQIWADQDQAEDNVDDSDNFTGESFSGRIL